VRTSPLSRLLSVVLAVAVGGALSGAAAAAVGGPDVSGWQHPNGYTIDWAAAHDVGGAQFAFVKATEGTGYTNKYFASDFAALQANRMARGAYHFAQPVAGTVSAVAQARHFVSVAGKLDGRGDLPPVLDLEVTGGLSATALVAWAKAYLAEVERLTGRLPMVYTSPGFWKSATGNSTAFTRYLLWIATWGPKPILAGGWTKHTFWQYTDQAALAGMAGPVDMSVFNGTVDELRTLANDAPVPPAPTGPPTAPATLTATPAGGTVALRWTPPTIPGGPIVAYDVTVDDGPPRRLPGTATTFTATGLSASAEHRFTVAAVNAAGSGSGATVSATPLIPARVVLATAAPAAGARSTTVTATVTRSDTGAALAGAGVTVARKPRTGTAPAPYTATTGDTGQVAIPVGTAVTTDVTVTVPKSPTVAAAVARTTVQAARFTPVLRLTLSATKVRAGRTVTFTGTTSRALAGEKAYRQSWYGGAWHTRSTATVRSTGVVAFAVRPLAESTSRYRLWVPATGRHLSAASASVTLRVV
jgi:lysozyme